MAEPPRETLEQDTSPLSRRSTTLGAPRSLAGSPLAGAASPLLALQRQGSGTSVYEGSTAEVVPGMTLDGLIDALLIFYDECAQPYLKKEKYVQEFVNARRLHLPLGERLCSASIRAPPVPVPL